MKDIRFAKFDNMENDKRPITVGQMRRAIIFGGIPALVLAACGVDRILNPDESSTSIPNSSELTPHPTFDVDPSELFPEQSLFLNKEVFGENTKIREFTEAEIKPYTDSMTKAANKMGWFDDNMQVEYDGIAYLDQTGLEVPIIIAFVTPIIDGELAEFKQMYMYAPFSDSDQSFVPAPQTPPDSEGRFFQIFYFEDGNDAYFGLGRLTDLVTAEMTVPLFKVVTAEDGTKTVIAYEPYSQSPLLIDKPLEAPDAAKKVFAVLLPVESQLPAEVVEKFNAAGIDVNDMGNASLDNDGLHITLKNGEVVDIKAEDLAKSVYIGQGNVLQIRDIDNTRVDYAYDKESQKFLSRSEYVHLDSMDVEGYIRVENMDGLDELARITEMLSMPFPENTYFPPIDVVDFDWANRQNPNYGYPFGELPEGMGSFLRIANYVIIGADPANGRPYESVAVLQHAYNADDETFGTIKYVKDIIDPEKEVPIEIEIIQNKTDGSGILLPHINLSPESIAHPAWTTIRKNYKDGGTYLRSLIKKWFQDQHLPDELCAGAWELTLKFFR